MTETLDKYLTAKINVTPSQIHRIVSSAHPVTLKRDELLENPNSDYYSLVLGGCLRCFRPDDNDGEQTLRFLPVGTWHSCQLGLPSAAPPAIFTDALVTTQLMRWTSGDMLQLREEIPAFDLLLKQVILENFSEMENRLYITTSADAERRYADFVSAYPQILHWAPLNQIASFLGIARETLSRIRNNKYPTASTNYHVQ
jgi:CRP-like cAMP-binding protein